MPGGWLIAVMVEAPGEPEALKHFFAVGHEDQGKAEWTAIDRAMQIGAIAPSPIRGQEPVEAVRRLTPQRMAAQGLKPGEIRALGWKLPRPWLT